MPSPFAASSRASRLSSAPSLSLLLLSTLLFLAFASTSALAHPRPHGSLVDHPAVFHHRDLWASGTRPTSPRPTPEPVKGGFKHLMATYQSLPSLPQLLSKRQATTCYGSDTTSDAINNYFATNGVDAGVLQLCPGASLSITSTILFTASNQGIQTQGGDTVALTSRARLTVTDSTIATMIQANGCINCNNLLVDSLILDGGRTALGALSGGQGMIEFGGTCNGHTVTNTQLANTRGWTSVHIIEGTCTNSTVANNVIGPSGTVDIIADGISMACRDSFVTGNTIFDATDGAIVIFGAPGTVVSGNSISANSQILLGGINMVDYSPYAGEYTGTLVHGNTIDAAGAQIIIGIAQGPSIWGNSDNTTNYGAEVYSNTFTGTHMTFGMAIAGVDDWSVTENIASSTFRAQGVKSSTCHNIGATIEPNFAVYDASRATALTLSEKNCWIEGSLQYLLCYDPDTSSSTAPNSAFLAGGTCTAAAPPTDTTAPTWTKVDYCIVDSATDRVLADDFIIADENSVTYCTGYCGDLGYNFAGMENSKQCYCSNTIATAAGQGEADDISTCTSVCPGDASQICGGNSVMMSLWYNSAEVSNPYPSASASASSSKVASSTVASSSRVSSSASSSKVSSSTSSKASSTTSSKVSSSTSSKASSTSSKASSTSSKASSSSTSSKPSSTSSKTSSTSSKASSTTSSKVSSTSSKASSTSSKASSTSSKASSTSSKASSTSSKASSTSSKASSTSSKPSSSSKVSSSSKSSSTSSKPSSTSSKASSTSSKASSTSSKAATTSSRVSSSTRSSSTSSKVSSTSSKPSSSSKASSTSSKASSTTSSKASSTKSASKTSTSISSSATPSASPIAASNGYTSLGCTADGLNGYLLQGYSFSSSSMTPDLCTSTCKSRNYDFAGVEYGDQCFCGNTKQTSGGGGAASDASNCDMKCAGDATKSCGGFLTLNLYYSSAVQEVASSASVASTSAAAVASSTPSSNGYTSRGCVSDSTKAYLLQDYSFSSSSMTPDLCTSTCKSKGFVYAGVEYGSQCFCGNSLHLDSEAGGISSSCTTTCSGGGTQKCGGFYAMNLYYSQAALGWSAGTCLTDDGARLLTGAYMEDASMTPGMCQAFCSEYSYAGTEFSTQCYCGNSIAATSSHGQASTSCSNTCGGDSSLKCGGSYAITVYTKNVPKWSEPTCVSDGEPRLLTGYYFEDAKMTNTLCQSTCKSKSYTYAATEYATQCYCGNSLATSSTVGVAASSSSCNYACAGDASTMCGGSYFGSLSTFA